MFEKFWESSINVIMLAQEEARRLGHNYVGTEMILLGLVAEGTGLAAKVLKSMRVNLQDARIEVEKIIGRGSGELAVEIPFTPRAKRLLELSLEESRLIGDGSVRTEHLLLGLIQVDDGVAARVLENLSADSAAIRAKVTEILLRKFNRYTIEPQKSDTGILIMSKPPIFETFTEKSIEVIMLAKKESRRLRHSFVGTEQILLGLIAERTGVAAKVLKSMGINLKNARIEVGKIIGLGSDVVEESIYFTSRASRVLDLSQEESLLVLGDDYIRTEHLLLGLIREEEGVGAKVLKNLGTDLVAIRTQIMQTINEDEVGISARVLENSVTNLAAVQTQVMQTINEDKIQEQYLQGNQSVKTDISSPSKLTISKLLEIGLIDTLAECFYQEEKANNLLLGINFPKRYQPNFNNFGTPFDFWQEICIKIESGILDCKSSQAGFELIVEQALSFYPSSTKLTEIKQRYFHSA